MKKIGVVIICFVLVFSFITAGHYFYENQDFRESRQLIVFSPKVFLENLASIEFPQFDVVSLLKLSINAEGERVSQDFVEKYIDDTYSWYVARLKRDAVQLSAAQFIADHSNVNTVALRGYEFTPVMIDNDGIVYFSYVRTSSVSDVYDVLVCIPAFVGGLLTSAYEVFLTLVPWNNAHTIYLR